MTFRGRSSKNTKHKRKATKNNKTQTVFKKGKPYTKAKSSTAKSKIYKKKTAKSNKTARQRNANGGGSYDDSFNVANDYVLNFKLNELKRAESNADGKFHVLRWKQRVARRDNATPGKISDIENQILNVKKTKETIHREANNIRHKKATACATPYVKDRTLRASVFNRL
jgi:hypothetical protein